jgi:flavin reductase (DIM6/NTAB) family NADH-FMN oxidoreductase RutF
MTGVVDALQFRRVLGNYPTGVSVITAIDADGVPAGIAVGTFTSVSLDPPLVAFLPDKGSSSFPRIRTASSFCVNVLSADQEDVCRAFAMPGGDKFAGIMWSPAPSGAPRLHGVVAWIDCDVEAITDAGDHYLVLGRVRTLDGADDTLPLVFFQGGYGRYQPSSLVAIPEQDVIEHLRHADLARTEMERIATDTGAECTAVAAVGDQLVVVARAESPSRRTPRTRVGQRSPFLAPLGTLLVPDDGDAWLARAGDLTSAQRAAHRERLCRARARGWSLSLGNETHRAFEKALGRWTAGNRAPGDLAEIRRLAAAVADRFDPAVLDPAGAHHVRLVSAPVLGADGTVMLLTLWGLPGPLEGARVTTFAARLRDAADRVSARIRAAC